MPNNSFRLFVVTLHDNRMAEHQIFSSAQERAHKNKDNQIETPDPIHYLDQLNLDVEAKKNSTMVFGSKAGEDQGSSTFNGHAIRLASSSRKTNLVELTFSAGATSPDGVLIDPEGSEADVDALGRAFIHPFRALLYAREGEKVGLLAVEVRGRSCPHSIVTRALANASAVPWRLRVHSGAADRAAIRDFVDRANVESVRFDEFGLASDGAKNPPKRKELRLHEVELGFFGAIRTKVKSWTTGGSSSKTSAQDLKTLVITEAIDIDFDDVQVELTDGKQTKTLGPDTDFDRFSYFLGEDVVSDSKFFSEATEAAQNLIEAVQATVSDTG